jgi:phenylpropionate dioxygenase-like ring-hydroxylating dioxygenase large terminal subunit
MYLSPEHNRQVAEKLFRHIRSDSTDMIDETYEYNLAVYSDPDIAVAERAKIFEHYPMMALHASQLPAPGSYATVKLNRTEALVTRGKDGKIHAFLNMCRHRGATLVTQASGKQGRFSCPYHGWTYTNEGQLIGLTFKSTLGFDLPCPQRNLIELPCEERHGFVWIVENPEGSIDVAAHLGPVMDGVLAGYGLNRQYFYREAMFDFDQNWKIMVDGLTDGYHVQWVHGPTIRPYFYMNIMARVDGTGDHAVTTTPRRKIDEILDTEPGAHDLDPYVVYGNMIFPNVSIQLHPHHAEFWTMYQDVDNPGRSRVHLRFLTPKVADDYDAKGRSILDKNWDIAEAAILNEDVPIGDSIQRSANMPNTGTMLLAHNEVINQQFHRSYDRVMAQEAAASVAERA